MPGKRTPAQNLLLKKLRLAGAIGIPIDQCHDLTLSSLVRRGDASITFGRAYVVLDTLEDDTSDGAA